MTSNLKNSGLTIVNGTVGKDDGFSTIIVVGVARSGTSMVGSVLYQLGVHIGCAPGFRPLPKAGVHGSKRTSDT